MSLIIKKNKYYREISLRINKEGISLVLWVYEINFWFQSWEKYYTTRHLYNPKKKFEYTDLEKASNIVDQQLIGFMAEEYKATMQRLVKKCVKEGIFKKEVLKELKENKRYFEGIFSMCRDYPHQPKDSNNIWYDVTYFIDKDWIVMDKWKEVLKLDQEFYDKKIKERNEKYKKSSFFDRLFDRISTL